MRSLFGRVVGERHSLQRQYALAAGVFGCLVLAIILLFGHLISQSLSRRYLEDILLSGRGEAQRIADELGQLTSRDLEVFEEHQERLARTLEGAPQRHVFDSIVVRDSTGVVVYTSTFRSVEDLPEELASDLATPDGLDGSTLTTARDSFKITAPIGEVGSVVLSISRARINERIGRLRRELLTQTLAVAVLTLTTLVVAFVLVWFLIQRTRRLEITAREAEEFAALGTLAANLAHEIRNPLNSINLNLELLEEDLEGRVPEAGDSLTMTRREVGRLARLVNDFLAYARPSEPVPEQVRVVPLLSEVREFLRAEAASGGVHLRLGGELDDATVSSDEGQLRQVLLNLVLNAIQAVSGLDAERRVVELGVEVDETRVALVVRDRGDGIPDDELEKVRDAFYTRRRGGTGLGLAIAQRFAAAQGGSIELSNLQPIGFESRVVLPIWPGNGKITTSRPSDGGR